VQVSTPVEAKTPELRTTRVILADKAEWSYKLPGCRSDTLIVTQRLDDSEPWKEKLGVTLQSLPLTQRFQKDLRCTTTDVIGISPKMVLVSLQLYDFAKLITHTVQGTAHHSSQTLKMDT